MVEKILIYDIESKTLGAKPDIKTDVLRVFGAYSYITNKYYIIPAEDKKFITKLIEKHDFLIGFNNKGYDNPVLENNGYNLNYKTIIDLREIFKKRAASMTAKGQILSKALMKYSLDFITKYLGLVDEDSSKADIDYNIFKKDKWTKKEIEQIKYYTKRDVEITKKLYEWVEQYFEAFKPFLPKEEVKKKRHITDTMAKFGYKANAHFMKWEATYNTEVFNQAYVQEEKISGGYVAYPSQEKISAKEIIDENDNKHYKDLIIQEDFSSLYPHIMIMANLHDRNKDNTGWHGGDLFEVEGYYNDKKLGDMARLLRKWYHLRLKYKCKGILEDGTIFKLKDSEKYVGKKYLSPPEDEESLDIETVLITKDKAEELKNYVFDKKEYTIKILLNLQYGILNHPYYELVYDSVAGGDCTRLGRQFVKYARKRYREEGYPIVYTDSVSKNTKISLENGEQIRIEDYWDKYTYNNFDDEKQYRDCKKLILTCDDNYKNKLTLPKKIIRHKTSKKMYRIILSNTHTLEVTDDHSLITIDPESQKLISVKPENLKNINYVLVNKSSRIDKKNVLQLSNVNKKIDKDFHLVRIKDIEVYYQNDYVYDFSVDKYERFYANDILVHNTDSWYFVDIYNDKDKYLKLKDDVIKEIKSSMPFPQLTFDADVDAVIKHIYFFKGKQEEKDTDVEMDDDDYKNKPKGLMKKNYIYVETDDSITIKNLGIAKKNITPLSKKIFWEKMKPRIIQGEIKFYKSEIHNWIIELLSKDLTLIYMRKDVKETKDYKKSKTGIQYQISKNYGPGIHFLIPNKRHVGIGKGVKYCSVEEFKELNMSIEDIDLSGVWKELKYFVKEPKTRSLFDY